MEFWAEPRNLPVAAEFLCFCGIRYWPVITGKNTVYFGRFQVAILYVYVISPWNTWLPIGLWRKECWNYWSELIWNIPSLFGRQLYFSVAVTGDKYCIFVWVQGAIKINYYMWKICRGEPRNSANWAVEFGKICRGKLWSLKITAYSMYKPRNECRTVAFTVPDDRRPLDQVHGLEPLARL